MLLFCNVIRNPERHRDRMLSRLHAVYQSEQTDDSKRNLIELMTDDAQLGRTL